MNNHRDTGATLLSVLLIVFLMSAAALTATEMLARSVQLAKVSDVRSGTFWTARGAATASQTIVGEVFAQTSGRLTEESLLLTDPILLPFEQGTLTVTFEDASNCFNLNSLLDDTNLGEINFERAADYYNLMISAGFFDGEARQLTDSLSDWMDADSRTRSSGAESNVYQNRDIPHRAANMALESVADLGALEHYTNEVIEQIAPLVCVRPPGMQTALNVNTINTEQAALLPALYSAELDPVEAKRLIARRPSSGWRSIDEFMVQDVIIQIPPAQRRDVMVSLTSNHVVATIAIDAGALNARFTALIGETPQKGVKLKRLTRRFQ